MTILKQQAQAALYSFPVNRQQYLVEVSSADAANWCCDNYEIIRKALTLLARDDVAILPIEPTTKMIFSATAAAMNTKVIEPLQSTSRMNMELRAAYSAMLSAAPDVMEEN